MSTDRELLEWAAKAAGLWDENDPSNGMLKGTGQYWNPLTDDGDALRLVAALRLNVYYDHVPPWRVCVQYPIKRVQSCYIYESAVTEVAAATRRAVVRAAAEIGKGMP